MNRRPHVLVAGLPDSGGAIALDEAASHHLARVLRIPAGQPLRLLDGQGGRAEATVREIGRRAVLEAGPRRQEPGPNPRFWAWLPLLRPERLETAVEKLTELGVARITLYASARTGNQRRPPDLARLGRVRDAALEQSGNPWRPRLDGVADLRTLLAAPEPGLLAGAAQAPRGRTPEVGGAGEWALLVGPEGGFDPDEEETVAARAAVRLCLGPHVLRAETAMLVLAGLARHLAARGNT